MTSNSPIEAVVRYDAIGSRASHVHTVQRPRLFTPSSSPLAIACSPRGTAIRNVYDALSSGWSLTGYQLAATCGWPATSVPSSVWMNPAPSSPTGTPSYAITVLKPRPLRRPCAA